jgi:hypothetical protein
MSGVIRGGVQPTAMPGGRYASQGMISPNGFVQPTGDLTAISFRFLHSLFSAIQQLEGQVTTLQASVQTLQAREPPP